MPKFLSDILAKAGLTVDGVVTLNNTATGQTPDSSDNSTKLATTAWVRGFVTPYTLPIASGTTLGGIRIGSGLSIDATGIVSVAASGVGAIRALQQITATTGQTVFTVSGGYTPGLIDVFLNGVLLTPTAIDASNGNTFTLADAAASGDLLDIFVYNPIYNGFISSTDQVPEGLTNLYFTAARAQAAITLTTTGNSGVATYTGGVLNIPTYTLSGLGGVPTTRSLSINGVSYDLSTDRSWSIAPNGTAGQILAKNSATSYDWSWIDNYADKLQHQVKLGEAMSIGTPVYVPTGYTSSTNMVVMKASNTAEATSSKTMGLVMATGVTNDFVQLVTEGLLSGINTSTANQGDPVWLGSNGTLIFGLANKPVAPAHLVFLGIVTRGQSQNGEIFVKVQNGFELDELHNVYINGTSNNQALVYESATSLWKNKTLSTSWITEGTNLYYTDARARAAISVTGSGSYDSATGIITVTGGVTSVNTLTGAVTLTTSNIAEGTNLYYTDGRVGSYLTTNNYATQAYVGTAIANLVAAAPATLDTLNELAAALGNDPNFATTIATSIGTKVPQARTITINGTSYDLSADRSWSIVSGVSSFNTRTGAITLSSTDVTTALTYTPVTNARTITINGTTYDLSADRSWSIAAGVTSFNTRTGAITLISSDVTTALGFTPASSLDPVARSVQAFTATAAQTTFTVSGGYTAGLIDVYINGIKLAAADYTATNGTTVVLGTGTGVGNIVEIVKYTSALTMSNALRTVTAFTATANQTVFTVSYNPGLIDVFYNGSKLAAAEYTATSGTSITLTTGAAANDIVEVVAYSWSVGAFSGVGGSGTSGYLPKFTAASTIGNSLIYESGTNIGIGTASPSNYGSSYTVVDAYNATAGGYFVARGPNVTLQLGVETNMAYVGTATNHNLRIQTAGNTRATFTNDGKYLFGTTSDNGYSVQMSGGNYGYYLRGGSSSSDNSFILTNSADTSVLIKVRGDGYMGIGVTNLSHRLQVQGNIYSTDTVFGRNLKPEAWVTISAGSPSSATIPVGYSTININSPCDNNWRVVLSNINDSKVFMWVTMGDAASKDTGSWSWQMTTPGYGVSNMVNHTYMDGGWNTGDFSFTYDASGGNLRLLVKCNSYYSSGNTAYGTIYFLRLE